METVKKFLSSDLVERAVWTFVQAFLAYVLLSQGLSTQAVLVGGVGAGLSALKTLALSFVKS